MEEPLLTCSICLNELENNNKCITNCEHSYCNGCLHNWFNQGHISCPMCRGDVKNFIHKNEVNHGTLIITDNQVKGKGRGKNKWFSIPGKSLTMSLILSVQIPINKAGLIPLIAGVSVINALDNPIINPLLKWPNDILIGEKK